MVRLLEPHDRAWLAARVTRFETACELVEESCASGVTKGGLGVEQVDARPRVCSLLDQEPSYEEARVAPAACGFPSAEVRADERGCPWGVTPFSASGGGARR